MGKQIIEATVPAAILGAVTFIATLIMSYFFGVNSVVSIGDSVFLNENQYINPVDIQTHGEELKNVKIVIDSIVTESQIKANQPVEIEILENKVGASNVTTIGISEIPKEQLLNLMIITSNKIDTEEIKAYSSTKKLDIIYESIYESPVEKQVKSALLTALMYAIILGILNYYSNKSREKLLKKYTEERERAIEASREAIEDIQEELRRAQENADNRIREINDLKDATQNLREKVDKANNDSLKKQILLQAKLHDYSKELNFWRNTIRKILYKEKSKYQDADVLFNIVSNTLKTYQTNDKNNFDFESLKALSKMIKDIDNDNKE